LGPVLGQPFVGNPNGAASPYPGFLTDWGSGVSLQQALRPFPQYSYIYTDVLQNIGQSSYESLQATLEHRLAAGLSMQASFTWEKILTDADSILPGINGGISQVQNPDNLNDEKALSSQDVPLTFTSAILYQLPFGKGKKFFTGGIGSAVLGGWQVGAILRYQSGTPISFGCANGIPGWDNCVRFNRGSSSVFSQAALSGNFNPLAPGASYFSPVCTYAGEAGCGFADPNTELTGPGSGITVQQARGGGYVLGNMPRNNPEAFGRRYLNEDISILRNFKIFENLQFQIKGELLNAFNRHIWAIPDAVDTAPYDPNFGVVTGTLDSPRIVQFTGRITF
jgi:hypothetical protein